MEKKKKQTQKADNDSVSEPEVSYVKKSEKDIAIPEGYIPLKEGMNSVRDYVKSLYE